MRNSNSRSRSELGRAWISDRFLELASGQVRGATLHKSPVRDVFAPVEPTDLLSVFDTDRLSDRSFECRNALNTINPLTDPRLVVELPDPESDDELVKLEWPRSAHLMKSPSALVSLPPLRLMGQRIETRRAGSASVHGNPVIPSTQIQPIREWPFFVDAPECADESARIVLLGSSRACRKRDKRSCGS